MAISNSKIPKLYISIAAECRLGVLALGAEYTGLQGLEVLMLSIRLTDP